MKKLNPYIRGGYEIFVQRRNDGRAVFVGPKQDSKSSLDLYLQHKLILSNEVIKMETNSRRNLLVVGLLLGMFFSALDQMISSISKKSQ